MPKVTLVEVGPRDGLQNESQLLTVSQRAHFIHLLAAAGHQRIEIGAFVNPKWVPQMADTDSVAKQLKLNKRVLTSALVANAKGLEQALSTTVNEVAFFIAVSETFNQRNINRSTKEALLQFAPLMQQAKRHKKRLRAYVSTAFGCPFEGDIAPARVVKLCAQLLQQGATELSISDTIGVATPKQVVHLTRLLSKHYPRRQLAMHFHDTRGMALTNCYVAYQEGIRIFDASSGGAGGCPFAPNASGNVATEDLLYLFESLNVQTGINLQKQLLASRYLEQCLKKDLPSRYLQAQTK